MCGGGGGGCGGVNRAPPAPPAQQVSTPELPPAQQNKPTPLQQDIADQMTGARAKVKRQPPPAAKPPTLSDQVMSTVNDFISRVKKAWPDAPQKGDTSQVAATPTKSAPSVG